MLALYYKNHHGCSYQYLPETPKETWNLSQVLICHPQSSDDECKAAPGLVEKTSQGKALFLTASILWATSDHRKPSGISISNVYKCQVPCQAGQSNSWTEGRGSQPGTRKQCSLTLLSSLHEKKIILLTQ